MTDTPVFQGHHVIEQGAYARSPLLQALSEQQLFDLHSPRNLLNLPADQALAAKLDLSPHPGGPLGGYSDGLQLQLRRLQQSPDGQATLRGDRAAAERMAAKVGELTDTLKAGLVNGDLHSNTPHGMTREQANARIREFFGDIDGYRQTHATQIAEIGRMPGQEARWAGVTQSEDNVATTLDAIDHPGVKPVKGDPATGWQSLGTAVAQANEAGRLSLSEQSISRVQCIAFFERPTSQTPAPEPTDRHEQVVESQGQDRREVLPNEISGSIEYLGSGSVENRTTVDFGGEQTPDEFSAASSDEDLQFLNSELPRQNDNDRYSSDPTLPSPGEHDMQSHLDSVTRGDEAAGNEPDLEPALDHQLISASTSEIPRDGSRENNQLSPIRDNDGLTDYSDWRSNHEINQQDNEPQDEQESVAHPHMPTNSQPPIQNTPQPHTHDTEAHPHTAASNSLKSDSDSHLRAAEESNENALVNEYQFMEEKLTHDENFSLPPEESSSVNTEEEKFQGESRGDAENAAISSKADSSLAAIADPPSRKKYDPEARREAAREQAREELHNQAASETDDRKRCR